MKKKPFSHCLLLMTASLTGTLLLLEGGVRMFSKPLPVIRVENIDKHYDTKFESYPAETLNDGTLVLDVYPDNGLYVYTPTGTRLKRNSRAIQRNHPFGAGDIEIETNSLGFRHPEIAAKEKDTLRILVLGDSITLGDWLPFDQTYPAQVSRHLLERTQEQGKKVEVINAGVGSIDLQNEYAILMESGLSVEPDIVLVGLYLNDAYESPSLNITRLPPWLTFSHLCRLVFDRIDKLRALFAVDSWKVSLPLAVERELDSFLLQHTVMQDGKLFFRNWLDNEIYTNFYDWGYAWSDGYWQRILPLLELMQETAEYEHFRLGVVLFPVAQQVHSPIIDDAPQQRFAAEMTRRNILHLNLLPALRAKFDNDRQNLFYDHCHYTREGNDFVGQQIADFITRNFDEIAGQRPVKPYNSGSAEYSR